MMAQRNSWMGTLWEMFASPLKAWMGPRGSLYYQPRRSFYSPSGYDLGTGTTATPPGMFGKAQLSSRRELVEQLDSEPLFDYLVQNGALELPMVEELRNEKSSAKVNLALLKHLENNGKGALNLFINALRQTGQHHLASRLDDSQRIKALSGSGYLSKKRHKGQVSLQIDVRAIRFPQQDAAVVKRQEGSSRKNASFRNLASREWVSLEEIRFRILELTEPKLVPPAVPQFEVGEGYEEVQNGKPSCLCMCFSRLFSRRKEQGQIEGQGHEVKGQRESGGKSSKQKQNGFKGGDGNIKTAKVYKVSKADEEALERKEALKEEELRNLRNLEDTFKSKVKELFVVLKEQPALMGHLSKYFEQDRGVLVLETHCELGLVILSICMKLDQLEQLRRDHSNGKLNKDLENCLITDQVLQKVGVKGIKLLTDINQEEFEIAEQELN